MIEINCCNCQRYPLCRVQTGIRQVLDLNAVHKTTYNIFTAVAKDCQYFVFAIGGK